MGRFVPTLPLFKVYEKVIWNLWWHKPIGNFRFRRLSHLSMRPVVYYLWERPLCILKAGWCISFEMHYVAGTYHSILGFEDTVYEAATISKYTSCTPYVSDQILPGI